MGAAEMPSSPLGSTPCPSVFRLASNFLIGAVWTGFKALPAEQQPRWQTEVQGFVGQEATQRRLYVLFNAQVEKQGLANAWEPSARERLRLVEGTDPRRALAITAVNGHATALFAEWMPADPERLSGWASGRERAAPESNRAVAKRRRGKAQRHPV
jgi:hypothetical protein